MQAVSVIVTSIGHSHRQGREAVKPTVCGRCPGDGLPGRCSLYCKKVGETLLQAGNLCSGCCQVLPGGSAFIAPFFPSPVTAGCQTGSSACGLFPAHTACKLSSRPADLLTPRGERWIFYILVHNICMIELCPVKMWNLIWN